MPPKARNVTEWAKAAAEEVRLVFEAKAKRGLFQALISDAKAVLRRMDGRPVQLVELVLEHLVQEGEIEAPYWASLDDGYIYFKPGGKLCAAAESAKAKPAP